MGADPGGGDPPWALTLDSPGKRLALFGERVLVFLMILIGTAINVVGILVGGVVGRLRKTPLSSNAQARLKVWIGVITLILGLQMVWSHLGGGFFGGLKQLGIVLLSMSLGKVVGQACRLQKTSNRLGQTASNLLERGRGSKPLTFSEGFLTCTILFCVAPLAVLGAVQEGVSGDVRTFVIKTAVDGLAAMAFMGIFGWTTFAVVLPVMAWQGSLTLLIRLAEPWLRHHGLVDSMQVTTGMLVFSVSLLIFQIRKVAVADYLPSLAIAPLLTWFFK